MNQTGISGMGTAAKNLRGMNLFVPQNSPGLKVPLVQETDTNYAILIQCSWPTATAVVEKDVNWFKVQFATPPSANATMDWFLVR